MSPTLGAACCNSGAVLRVQGHTDELWGLASHPSSRMFLTCAQDRLVCLWNAVDHSLQWIRTLEVTLSADWSVMIDGCRMVD